MVRGLAEGKALRISEDMEADGECGGRAGMVALRCERSRAKPGPFPREFSISRLEGLLLLCGGANVSSKISGCRLSVKQRRGSVGPASFLPDGMVGLSSILDDWDCAGDDGKETSCGCDAAT